MRAPSSSSASNNKPTPCCSKVGIKRGPWTPEEDKVLSNYVKKEGEGRWRTLPKRAGLQRCGKSCRLRWVNYLRPNVKRGQIDPDEEDLILRLHRLLGNRWSLIAGRIPGRTDNEIKNYWNTHLSKKLISQGIDPRNHKPLNHNPIITAAAPNNDEFAVPKNSYAPMLFPTPPQQYMAYQNPPLIQETSGTFNHGQVSATVHVGDDLNNVVDGGHNQFLPIVNQHQTQVAIQPCNEDLQYLERLITLHNSNNNNNNVYVTEPSCAYYQDTFSLFLDALINDSYGGT